MQRTPNVPVRNGGLTSVSCASPAACTAVGGYENRAGTGVTLAEQWDGTSWHRQAIPSPAGAVWSMLFGVSCRAANACMAVGYYRNRAGRIRAVAEWWDGTSWRI